MRPHAWRPFARLPPESPLRHRRPEAVFSSRKVRRESGGPRTGGRYVRTCSYRSLIARNVGEKTRACELECMREAATSKYYLTPLAFVIRTPALTLSGEVVSFESARAYIRFFFLFCFCFLFLSFSYADYDLIFEVSQRNRDVTRNTTASTLGRYFAHKMTLWKLKSLATICFYLMLLETRPQNCKKDLDFREIVFCRNFCIL